MRLFALICVTMCAFAANSVLTRAGIDRYGMTPLGFAGVRLVGGAVILALIVGLRGGWPAFAKGRLASAVALLVYLVPFSLAYLVLPSGIGALILFGVVQLTMFIGAALGGQRPTARQWIGMSIAMAGLAWLLVPRGGMTLDLFGVGAMVLSGVGWGWFSMRGRGSRDPLGDMAFSFVLALPVAGVLIVAGDGWMGTAWTSYGVATAVLSGTIMSGLGYGLWYHVLPQIAATTAAVAQLSVPVIALIAGAVLLGEVVSLGVVLAAAVVLGGIAVAVVRRP